MNHLNLTTMNHLNTMTPVDLSMTEQKLFLLRESDGTIGIGVSVSDILQNVHTAMHFEYGKPYPVVLGQILGEAPNTGGMFYVLANSLVCSRGEIRIDRSRFPVVAMVVLNPPPSSRSVTSGYPPVLTD